MLKIYNTYYTGRVHGSINSTERVGVTEGSIRAPPLARLLHPKVKISLPHTHTQTHTLNMGLAEHGPADLEHASIVKHGDCF